MYSSSLTGVFSKVKKRRVLISLHILTLELSYCLHFIIIFLLSCNFFLLSKRGQSQSPRLAVPLVQCSTCMQTAHGLPYSLTSMLVYMTLYRSCVGTRVSRQKTETGSSIRPLRANGVHLN